MTFRNFVRELNGSRVEGELIKTVFYSLATSFILLGLLYVLKFRNAPEITGKYGFYLLFASLSYAFIIPTVRQVRAYREFPCMSGMMIGMTSGMIAGFLPGLIIGSTNGMFIGGIFGIALGIGIGTWAGKCCGIMGFMEGIMAGFMGGLMGAMTALMMFNDHLKESIAISFIISGTILTSLNYMIFKEMKENEKFERHDHLSTIVLTFLLIAATAFVMVYGPRSVLFQ